MFDLEHFLKQLPAKPGIYKMYDAQDHLIYVGKAKKLDRRVKSYFQKTHLDSKTIQLVSQVARIEITLARTEYEALVLESNLIKQHRPKYNIVFRDDKSYPFAMITPGDFPRLVAYRGKRSVKAKLLGPFPDMRSLRHTLSYLQKVFKFRQCEDTTFKNRSRPCLQYQIGRCSAPCVDYISKEAYAADIQAVKDLLTGKDIQVIAQLETAMLEAAEQLEFERAGRLRDQIQALHDLRNTQSVFSTTQAEVDVLAVQTKAGLTVVTLLFVRNGKVLGTRDFWPKGEGGLEEICSAFLEQYYGTGIGSERMPKVILTNVSCVLPEVLEAHFQATVGFVPKLLQPKRGERYEWLKLALLNAEQALDLELTKKSRSLAQWAKLADFLKLKTLPKRIECFDISHTQGQSTVASCVVFGPEGPLKKQYRRFNIAGITPGDDYAALKQAITRRYLRLQAEKQEFPDVLMIDGGPNQLRQGIQVWQEHALPETVTLMSVAKGESRKAGLEVIWLAHKPLPLSLDESDAALHLIQQIRDEAHRFAITGHRKKREKASLSSTLRSIPGVGPKRAKNLLTHFGGLQQLSKASVEQIAQLPGISRELAQKILDTL